MGMGYHPLTQVETPGAFGVLVHVTNEWDHGLNAMRNTQYHGEVKLNHINFSGPRDIVITVYIFSFLPLRTVRPLIICFNQVVAMETLVLESLVV